MFDTRTMLKRETAGRWLRFRGLGDDVGTVAQQQAAFSAENRAARAAYIAGDASAAQAHYQAAVALAYNLGADYGSDDLAYTRSIIYGDQSAATDWQAANALLARTQINARPDSVWGAELSGFKEGVKEQVSGLAGLAALPWGKIALGGVAVVVALKFLRA